ncbi:MAG: galactose ABC transporter substrate-binding protein [Deltaproteobacteria bacterium]|jgi:methyl-galactoside transport system substrate-binding protein|nr:galactose ABC transporter substrate-binding protein [Deltaproteobacteria bacterium]
MKSSLSRGLLRIAALAALVFFAAGCGEEKAPQPGKTAAKPSVGVLLYREDDVYISMVSKALAAELEGKADFVIQAAGNNQLTQNDQLDALLAKKVSVLALNLVDTQAASFVLDKVEKAGIPVIFFNREPDLDSIKSHARACYVGTVPSDAGKMQGDIIKQLWDAHPEYDRNKDGQFQYIMIQANADNPESVARTEYSVRQARERGVNMRQLGETLLCEWNEAQTLTAMRLALGSRLDAVELVIANNDAMALGAIAALAEQGFNTGGEPAKFIPVIGVDAVPSAMEAIRKGVMSATVKQDDKLMAQTIAALILNAAHGKNFLEGTMLTWDASGIAVRLPYFPYTGTR